MEKVLAVIGVPYDVELTVPGRRIAKARRGSPCVGYKVPASGREWAKANGHAVSDRGRVAAAVTAAYVAAGVPTD